MVTWDRTTLSRFGFERQTRSFSWTSRSSAVLGELSDDLVSVLTSGDGSWRTAFKAVRFSCRPSLTTLHLPIYGYCVTLAHSDDSSLTLMGKDDLEILARGLASFTRFEAVVNRRLHS
jgi:hypothetical protein